MGKIQSLIQCPRCAAERLYTWEELNDGEREIARRLLASADTAERERRARHRWCVRCWHEEADERPRTV